MKEATLVVSKPYSLKYALARIKYYSNLDFLNLRKKIFSFR